MNILITGAAGALGLRLVARLVAAGHRVRGLVLSNDPQRGQLERLGAHAWQGDIVEPASLIGICDGIDTLYHLAAVIIARDPAVFARVNRDGTANMVAAAASARVRHFVYVSSASVTYPKRTPYGDSKLQAEALVTGSGEFAYTIARPTLVYDAHGGQELRMFIDYLRRFPVVPFIGAGDAVKRPVWSEDVVEGLARIAGCEAALGKTYNLSGGEAISMRELARSLLAHHGAQRPFAHLPVWLCRAMATVLAIAMRDPPLTHSAIAGVVNDADLDPSPAMHDLGYRPIGVRAGFSRCFARVAPLGTLLDRKMNG